MNAAINHLSSIVWPFQLIYGLGKSNSTLIFCIIKVPCLQIVQRQYIAQNQTYFHPSGRWGGGVNLPSFRNTVIGSAEPMHCLLTLITCFEPLIEKLSLQITCHPRKSPKNFNTRNMKITSLFPSQKMSTRVGTPSIMGTL